MKQKLLFAVAAIMASALSFTAKAGSWVAPTPTPSDFTSGSIYYLYNSDASLFFTEGNDWGTRASVGATGLKVKIDKLEDGSYTLNDFSVAKNAWKYVFIDSPTGSYVDMGSQGHNFFALTDMGSQMYRISCFASDATYGADAFPNYFYGYIRVEGSTVITPLIEASAEGACLNWQLITEDNYSIYQAKKGLYEVLNEAEEAGVSTTDAETVYNNAASTVEELDAAKSALKAVINGGLFATATADNPANVTSLITNPAFDNEDNTGWSGSAPGHQTYKNAEFYNTTFDFYQVISGLPEGVFKFACQGFYRDGGVDAAASARSDGDEKLNAYLYAGSDSIALQSIFTGADQLTDGVSSSIGIIPNVMQQAGAWFDAGNYVGNEVYSVPTDGSLKVGLKKTVAVGSDWTIFDNFTLLYYGNTAESYKLLLKKTIDETANIVSEDDILGTPEKDALSAEHTSAQSVYDNAAATVDEVKAADAALKAAAENAQMSKEAYAALKTALADAENALGLYTGEAADALSDFYMEADDAYNMSSYTTDECNAAVTKINDLITQAKNQAIQVGDVTYLITNPQFDANSDGWSGTAPTVSFQEAEFYNKTFNIYQTLTGLQNGKYTLKVAGYFRPLANGDAFTQYKAGTDDIRCVLYANANTKPMMNVCAGAQAEGQFLNEGIGGTYPYDYLTSDNTYFANSMEGARKWFDAGNYDENEVSVVVTDNQLTLGIKLDDATGYSDYWCLFDNFRLNYDGSSAEVLSEELTALINEAQTLASQPMCADSLQALNDAITAAANAGDEDAISAISALYAAIPAAQSSINTYKKLKEAIDDVETKANELSISSAEAAAAFTTADSEANSTYTSGSSADADVPEAIAKLYAALNSYTMGDMADASDSNPYDVTGVIINPTFANNNSTGWSGTTPTAQGYANVEMYNKNFDYNQTIGGLRNGFYKLTVDGFYRAGLSDDAQTARDAGTEALNAILYANEKSTPMMSILDGKSEEEMGTGTSTVTGGYVPNNLETADIYCQAGNYAANELWVEVTDGTLKIGVKKDTAITNDWTNFDNFKLEYHGTESPTSVDGIAADTTPVSVQYFGVNGAQNSKLVKGINIVKTKMSDGSVKVEKVLVK